MPSLTKLTELDLAGKNIFIYPMYWDDQGNAITEIENYRLDMILLLPQLKKLDEIFVTEDERVKAIKLKQQREEAAKVAAEAAEWQIDNPSWDL